MDNSLEKSLEDGKKSVLLVREEVANFLNEYRARSAKLQQSINALQKEEATVQNSINSLMKDVVHFTVSDNEPGREAANNKLVELNSKLADLQRRIAVFKNAINEDDYAINREGARRVMEVANKQRAIMRQATADSYKKWEELKREEESARMKIRQLGEDMSLFYDVALLNRELEPLKKYLEPRVKPEEVQKNENGPVMFKAFQTYPAAQI